MKKIIGLFLLIWTIGSAQVSAQSETNRLDSIMPVRGLAIAAPSAQKLDLFLKFVQEELAPSHFNLLILRVDWNYAYESHPELRDPTPLTREDVKKIVKVCRDNGIRIAPQINLLGHQSWVFRYTALDGNGCNMAGSFAEDLVKCLQNGLNFSGIGGRTDNLVHNQHYSEN